MAQTDKARRNRRLTRSVRNVSLIIVLGALLCVGGTLTYLNARANTVLDDIQANEVPEVELVASYVTYDGTGNAGQLGSDLAKYTKVSTLDSNVSTSYTPGSTAGTFSTASDLRLVTHTVDRTTGAITKTSGVNYDNMIVQVHNLGAPAFVRVWISSPMIRDDQGTEIKKYNESNVSDLSQSDDYVRMYWKMAPFYEPGTVPNNVNKSGEDIASTTNTAQLINENMLPFGYDGSYTISRDLTPSTYSSINGTSAAEYGKIVYHFAENWQENWIYVGNSGYLDESQTTYGTATGDDNDFDQVVGDSEESMSGGYFVYRHILGAGGVTAPLLTGVSYSSTDVDGSGYPAYNVDVSLKCDALTSLQETLDLAQAYRWGWGSGRIRRTAGAASGANNTYTKPEARNGRYRLSTKDQQFDENRVTYSGGTVKTPDDNVSSYKPWYAEDKSLWYVVQNALTDTGQTLSGGTPSGMVGLTKDQALHATVTTPGAPATP